MVFQATHLFRSASQGGGDVMEQYANVVGVQWNYEDMEAEVSAIPWEESVSNSCRCTKMLYLYV